MIEEILKEKIVERKSYISHINRYFDSPVIKVFT
jgi:hypothetical protein